MHTAVLAIALSIMHFPNQAAPVPTDPFQRCALSYLAGDKGKIDPKLAKIYRRGLEQGLTTKRRIWFTCYYPREGKRCIDAHGRKCGPLTASANKIEQFGWVWSPQIGLRQVSDRGAHRNDWLAQHPPVRHGKPIRPKAELWTDIWYKNSNDCKWGRSQVMLAVIIE